MVHVPYKGTAPALTALMSGDIQMLVDVPSSLMPHVRGGKVRALGMFSAKRVVGAPEVPTIAEAGGPALEASTWVLFLMPAGSPRDAVNRVSSEVAKILATPEMRERLEKLGIDAVGSTPEQGARFLDEEIAKWSKVINTAGIKAEQ
jgi:tripartite-type tricarboxylate transporter receptor subunit TctC